MLPRKLNKRAAKVFRRLIEGLKHGESRTIDNTDGVFMPVSVEMHGTEEMPVVYLAHYFEQHGDLMADPLMLFCIAPLGEIYAMSLLQDPFPAQVGMTVGEDRIKSFSPKMQRELATFASQWLVNIHQQQFAR